LVTILRIEIWLIVTFCGEHSPTNKKEEKQSPKIPLLEQSEIFEKLEIPTNKMGNPSTMLTGNTYCPKLGVTLDWQGFGITGTVAEFNSDLQTIINVANSYHDDEYSVEFELTPIYVISVAPNPWTDDPCCNGSANHGNYRDWAKDNFPYLFTCTMLFTG